MKRLAIQTFEEIHHVCLMYGLKRAFERFPFLAANIMATPPPIRRKPEKSAPLLWFRRNPVNVQYFKNDILVVYNAEKAGYEEVSAFARAVMDEYLTLRHPYMKIVWENNILKEAASGHVLAQINPEYPATDGTL